MKIQYNASEVWLSYAMNSKIPIPSNRNRTNTSPFTLVLASASPRRQALLRNAGLRFRAVPSGIKEHPPRPGERRAAYAIRLATEKARSIISRVGDNAVILAADTIVCIGGKVLGKPKSALEARQMLRLLSGRTHSVITGVVMLDCRNHRSVQWSERTLVRFAQLSELDISEYIRSGEPFDKAGAYAVQGKAGKFVARIEGCYFNVMGLPIGRVYREFQKMGLKR